MTISVDTSYYILFIITNILDLYFCFLYLSICNLDWFVFDFIVHYWISLKLLCP